jgi:hypothetical protein
VATAALISKLASTFSPLPALLSGQLFPVILLWGDIPLLGSAFLISEGFGPVCLILPLGGALSEGQESLFSCEILKEILSFIESNTISFVLYILLLRFEFWKQTLKKKNFLLFVVNGSPGGSGKTGGQILDKFEPLENGGVGRHHGAVIEISFCRRPSSGS